MSYSFSVKASSKSAAKEAVAEYFDKQVIAYQPVHARDRAAVLANASAAVDLLGDDDTKDVQVSCNGSVGWRSLEDHSQVPLNSVSVAANAFHAIRE